MNKAAELKQKTFMHNGKLVKGTGNKGGLSGRAIKDNMVLPYATM